VVSFATDGEGVGHGFPEPLGQHWELSASSQAWKRVMIGAERIELTSTAARASPALPSTACAPIR